MTEYRRIYIPGASCFFTVNLTGRKWNRLLIDKIDLLREAFEYTKQRHSFRMDAVGDSAGSFILYLDIATR